MNSFVDDCDYDDAKAHRVIAFKIDILDSMNVISSKPVVSLASRNEAIPETNSDADEDEDPNFPNEMPTTDEDNFVRDPTTTFFLLGIDHMDMQDTHAIDPPMRVIDAPLLSPIRTPTSRVGFPSTAGPSRAAGGMGEKNEELATEVRFTASSGGGSEHTDLLPMESRDVLELLLRPDISICRENR